MADNVGYTEGSGKNIGTDERSINSVTVHVQRTNEQGSTAFDADQIAPTSTATSASIAARETRKRLVLANYGTVDVYVSDVATNAGASTTDNSFKLVINGSATLYTTAAVYIFTASGTGAVHYFEEYDA